MGLLLSLIGWESLDDESLRILQSHKRIVVVYPHTATEDFILYGFYMLANDALHSRCRALINPRFMDTPILGQVGKLLGGIKSTPGSGTVKGIIQSLSKLESFIFLISPKGSIARGDWRSGYYHIAKELDALIVPAGFDYRRRKFVVKEGFMVSDLSLEQVHDKAKCQLRDIYPRHPCNIEYPVDFDTTQSGPSIMSLWRWIVVAVAVILVIVILYQLYNKWRDGKSSPM